MKKNKTLKSVNDMKLINFFLAAIAGFGLVKFFGYITEAELNEETESDINDEDEYPLFV